MNKYTIYLYGYLFIGLSFYGIFNINGQTEEISIAYLNGSQVLPQVDTNASGKTTFVFFGDNLFVSGIYYNITVQNISDITAIELHRAPEKINGTLLTNDFQIASNYQATNVVSEGDIDNLPFTFTSDLGEKGEAVYSALKRLIDDKEVYIDIHTKKYPEGEIRGQLN